jgi:thiamine-phosphate pyrophosphorylase
MPARLARQRLRDHQVLGVSTHEFAQARAAVADGADHIGIGPCFATPTKGYDRGLEPAMLRSVFTSIALPSFAIGGITPERVATLRELGCSRVAVSTAILQAEDTADAVRRFLAALG